MQTKLNRPEKRPFLVARPSLLQKLNKGHVGRLTVVTAPAGFGKTTLISCWLDELNDTQPSAKIAWVSLDEGDNVRSQFLLYLISALETAVHPQTIPHLQTIKVSVGTFAQTDNLQPLLVDLLNAIHLDKSPITLILDDYHLIENETVHAVVHFISYFLFLILLLGVLMGCSATKTETAVTLTPLATTIAEAVPTTKPEPTAPEVAATATAVPLATPTETLEPLPEPTATAVPIERFDATNILPLYSTEPVIEHGEEGDWDRNLDIAAVLYHDGQFHAFLNRFPGWPPTTFGLSYHTSPDGLHWTQMADGPVFSQQDLPNKNHVPIGGSMHVEEDGTWVHYFYTWNKGSGRSVNYIGRATAPNPLGPWTADEAYVLEPGETGSWDAGGVRRPFVVKNEAGYVMYYVGVNGRAMIGMATSPDGINWTKYDDPETTDSAYADSDPVFRPSNERGRWDERSVSDPLLLQTPDGWVLLYASSVGNGVQVGVALSDDGIHCDDQKHPCKHLKRYPIKLLCGLQNWFIMRGSIIYLAK